MTIEQEISKKVFRIISKADIRSILVFLAKARWAILLSTLLGVSLGFIYAFGEKPVYSASSLIYITRESPSSVKNTFEIIKSKKLLGEIVAELSLDISVEAKEIPLFGHVYRHFFTSPNSLINPNPIAWDILNNAIDKYNWSYEKVTINSFEVPRKSYNKQFILRVEDNSSYSLLEFNGEKIISGKVAKKEIARKEIVNISISNIYALRGTEFIVIKKHKVDAVNDLLDSLKIISENKDSDFLHISIDNNNPSLAVSSLNLLLSKLSSYGNVFNTKISIVDYASVDKRIGLKPQKKERILFLGFLMGAILGIVIASLGKLVRNKYVINDYKDLQNYTDNPIYAFIPFSKRSQITNNNFSCSLFRSMEPLYVNLLNDINKKGKNIVLFTSPLPSSDKSTIASNFTTMVSNNFKQNTILIDTDFYNSRLRKELGIENKLGLANYLNGTATLDEVINSIDGINLKIICSGTYDLEKATALLMRKKMIKLISKLSNTYDLVVIDTAPLFIEGVIATLKLGAINLLIVPTGTPKSYLDSILRRFSQLDIKIDGYIYNETIYRRSTEIQWEDIPFYYSNYTIE